MPEAGARLVVYTREGCALCDDMVAELTVWLAVHALEVEVRDVDADAATRARYGMMVPVLTLDGAPLCSGRFDPDTLDGLAGT